MAAVRAAHAPRSSAARSSCPTCKPPVTTAAQAVAYRERILRRRARGRRLRAADDALPHRQPAARRDRGAPRRPASSRVKLYPAGATTNSDAGVTDIRKTYQTLEAHAARGHAAAGARRGDRPRRRPLRPRGGVHRARSCVPLRRDFPELKIVFEHITTKRGRAVRARGRPPHGRHHHRAPPALQPQRHLPGGIRPHYYCLPVLKRETHRQALVEAATSGSPKFFLGTDSAPHAGAT